MAIQVAESSKGKKAPKTISHLEIHPRLGGGHVVKHVYQSYEHPTRNVEFNKEGVAKGGEHIMAHLAKHAGLPSTPEEGYEEHDESETEGEISA